jgi:hypothetical protein
MKPAAFGPIVYDRGEIIFPQTTALIRKLNVCGRPNECALYGHFYVRYSMYFLDFSRRMNYWHVAS